MLGKVQKNELKRRENQLKLMLVSILILVNILLEFYMRDS